jgi:hypothetical protein
MDIAELFRLYQKNPKEYRRYIDCLDEMESLETFYQIIDYIKGVVINFSEDFCDATCNKFKGNYLSEIKGISLENRIQ